MVTAPGPAASSVTLARSTRAPSLTWNRTPVIGASIGWSAALGRAAGGFAAVSVMTGSPRSRVGCLSSTLSFVMAFELTKQIEDRLADDEIVWLTTVTPGGRGGPGRSGSTGTAP